MSLEVEIIGDYHRIDGALVSTVLACSASRLPAFPNGRWTIAVVLADTDQISRLHADYFDDPSPTDVISFPSGDEEHAGAGHLGDVVIGVEVACEQAATEGHSVQREVVYLALHGLLHLCGYVDATEDEKTGMLQRQSELLESYERVCGSV